MQNQLEEKKHLQNASSLAWKFSCGSSSKNSAFAVSFADMAATSSFLGFGARFVLLLLLGTCHNWKAAGASVVPKLPECLLENGLCSDLRFVALWSYSHQSLLHGLPHTPYLMTSCEVPPPLSFSTANLKGHVLTSRAPTGHCDGPGRLWNDYEMDGFWRLIASCMVQCVFLLEKACV